MSVVINVTEFKEEGFAIIEDNRGKFIATKVSSDIIPLSDKTDETYKAWLGRREPCALLQSRTAMMT